MERSPLHNNLVQLGQQQYTDEQKFNIIPIDCLVSNKTMTMQQKPCKAYVEIQFNKDADVNFFHYIVLQNFYTFSVSVKQFKLPSGVSAASDNKELRKVESNWVTILKDYQLMRNAHFETDAQNWHILGTELFNNKFDRRNLKFLRIYLKQPSPSWLDYTLRNITLYMKKIETKTPVTSSSMVSSSSHVAAKDLSPFEAMKAQLRNNLKGLKKEEDKENGESQGTGYTIGGGSSGQANPTQNIGPKRIQDMIPPFSYGEDIRKIDLIYNIQ